jgi:hypothetical protein
MAEAGERGETDEKRAVTDLHTFKTLLSEGWETSGDGIYRRVGDAPRPAGDLADALRRNAHPPRLDQVTPEGR